MSYKLAVLCCAIGELKWQKINTSYYNGPSGRTSASVQEVDGKLILFGGYNGVYSNELFSYDISKLLLWCKNNKSEIGTHTWEKLKTKGELPRGRAYHTAVYYQGQYIVWGGEIAHQRCIYSLHACQLAGEWNLRRFSKIYRAERNTSNKENKWTFL